MVRSSSAGARGRGAARHRAHGRVGGFGAQRGGAIHWAAPDPLHRVGMADEPASGDGPAALTSAEGPVASAGAAGSVEGEGSPDAVVSGAGTSTPAPIRRPLGFALAVAVAAGSGVAIYFAASARRALRTPDLGWNVAGLVIAMCPLIVLGLAAGTGRSLSWPR